MKIDLGTLLACLWLVGGITYALQDPPTPPCEASSDCHGPACDGKP